MHVHEQKQGALQEPGSVDSVNFQKPIFAARRHTFAVLAASASSSPLPHLGEIQRSFGHHNISHVFSHTDRASVQKAWSMGAEAFTSGAHVTFLRSPGLHTAAHEAAHVIQQSTGANPAGRMGREGDAYERHADEVADRVVRGQSSEILLDAPPCAGANANGRPADGRDGHPSFAGPAVIQMRRIPPNVRALLMTTTGGQGANFAANAAGVQRLITMAMEELGQGAFPHVLANILSGRTIMEFATLPLQEQLSICSEAILAEFPDLELGAPALLDVYPRAATADVANIGQVVAHTNALFDAIAAGTHDDWLEQVFGAANVAAAKSNYAQARTRLNHLQPNSVVTDRGSGFSEEVDEGGLTGSDQISVASDVIDDPNNIESRMTLLHESMHAGNDDIGDDLYIGAPGFTSQTDAQKLVNAAHYEVAPWRILAPNDPRAYQVDPPTTPPTFQVFIPAGTTVGGVTAPSRTLMEEASVNAYAMAREAWALGLNLHRQYVKIYVTPAEWTTPQFGGTVRYDNSIPFWSKVEKMTVHQKNDIDPTSADAARHPVSQIDIALSEGLTRRLSLTMDVLGPLETESDISSFIARASSPFELITATLDGAFTNVDQERDFLLKLAVRQPSVHLLTGNEDRDVRVLHQMGDPSLSLWRDILQPRDPASFPD